MGHFLNRDQLLSGELPEASRARRTLALDLFDAALDAIDPVLCTERALVQLKDQDVSLDGCTLFAFGKAAAGMARAAAGEVDLKRGTVIGFEDREEGPLRYFAGSHPVPSDDAPRHGAHMLEQARELGEGDTALVLISGGGSALLELPAPGLCMRDLQETTRALLACGANITEVNAVRRALSQLKGGGLARAIAPARVINIVLSDVIGSPLPSIASGPSVPPEDDLSALEIVGRYQLDLPDAVRAALDRPVPSGEYGRIDTIVAADNASAQEAMLDAALERGLEAERHPYYLQGEARDAGAEFHGTARKGGTCVVAGGETTVTLRGSGRGGRNSEFVLGAADGFGDGLLASMGTDGIDGASDAAGALLDAQVIAAGGDPEAALSNNDSASYFADAGGALTTGRTGTNVADVALYIPQYSTP